MNRADAVVAAHELCEALADTSPTIMNVHENLFRVVGAFAEDVREARIRGRRAQLFAGNGDCRWLDADSIENDETLAEIGGEIVP